MELIVPLAIVSTTALNIGAQMIFKVAFRDAETLPQVLADWRIWSATLLYGAALITYLFVLSRAELSRVLPITQALTILSLCVISVLYLGEALTVSKATGAALLIVGIWFISQ